MERLVQRLASLDGKNYKAYKSLEGCYQFECFTFQIDHVQGDPFANPTRCRLFISAAQSRLESSYYSTPIRRIALEDYIGRQFTQSIKRCVKGNRGSGMSGQMLITDYGQQVLIRNAVLISDGAIELRLQLGLPADKRTINMLDAQAMLLDELPALVEGTLLSLHSEAEKLITHIEAVDNQHYLRQ